MVVAMVAVVAAVAAVAAVAVVVAVAVVAKCSRTLHCLLAGSWHADRPRSRGCELLGAG